MIGALLLAAGSGSRMQGEIKDKLLHPIGTKHAFFLSCQSFLQVEEVSSLVITYKDSAQLSKLQESWEQIKASSIQSQDRQVLWVKGGKARQDSVDLGLHAFPKEITHTMIHDCARPFIRPQTISQCAREIAKDRSITLARHLKDTLRLRVEGTQDPLDPAKTRTLDRANHWLIETPQGAPKAWLLEGLKKAKKENILLTDDMAAVELIGHPVGFIEPNYPNPKITTPDDFAYAEFLYNS